MDTNILEITIMADENPMRTHSRIGTVNEMSTHDRSRE